MVQDVDDSKFYSAKDADTGMLADGLVRYPQVVKYDRKEQEAWER
jgi:hypothetical protein